MKSLVYRPPFANGKPAAWINALGRSSGAYVIRSRGGRTLYVGESHTGRLAKTLKRHFYRWRGKTAGNTYDPGSVEVAVRVCPPSAATTAQNNLINRLGPRDNKQGVDAPF